MFDCSPSSDADLECNFSDLNDARRDLLAAAIIELKFAAPHEACALSRLTNPRLASFVDANNRRRYTKSIHTFDESGGLKLAALSTRTPQRVID
jgi:hypothetical protein